MYFIALTTKRITSETRLELSNLSERRVAQEVPFRISGWQIERHIQVGSPIFARSIERLLDPLRSEGQIDPLAVSNEEELKRALHLHASMRIRLKPLLHARILRVEKLIARHAIYGCQRFRRRLLLLLLWLLFLDH
jgi:hypothetical protein